MTNPTQIRWILSALLLAAGFFMGCTPQASGPVDNADATQGTAAPEVGGAGDQSDASSGSGSK